MPGKRINGPEDLADHYVAECLKMDWVTRQNVLSTLMKSRLKNLLPNRLSPCQSTFGKSTGKAAPDVIALPNHGVPIAYLEPPLKQRKISEFGFLNDRPQSSA